MGIQAHWSKCVFLVDDREVKMGVILVVEDSRENALFIKQTLEEYNYEIVVVDDGFAALEYCQNNSPDIIFLDITLPGIDGLEVCQRLRSSESTSKIPIIAVTAHVSDNWDMKTKEVGFDAYIKKPFSKGDIADIAQKYFV